MKKLYSSLFAVGLCLMTTDGFSAIVFNDNFDAEVGSNVLNYDSFNNWDVFDGSVDIISSGGFGISCFGGSGKCVDLDGTTSNAALFITKQAFDLSPGIYELTFALSGNQRGGSPDSVTVSLGNVFSETFTKSSGEPFQLITRSIVAPNALLANISFDHGGGDNLGIILDNVTLTIVPIPTAGWLFLSAILGFYGFKKRATTDISL